MEDCVVLFSSKEKENTGVRTQRMKDYLGPFRVQALPVLTVTGDIMLRESESDV